MRTLYLRNVPDDVAEALEELAGRAGMSMSAFAVKELTESARRARNREIFEQALGREVPMERIVEAIRAGRDER